MTEAVIPMVDEDKANVTDLVSLYDPVTCTRCDSLIHFTDKEKREYKNQTGMNLLRGMELYCHYSNGNALCPASTLNFSAHVDISKVVSLYLSAFESGNITRLQKILNRIKSKGPVMEKLIMDQIKDTLQAHILSTNTPAPNTTDSHIPTTTCDTDLLEDNDTKCIVNSTTSDATYDDNGNAPLDS